MSDHHLSGSIRVPKGEKVYVGANTAAVLKPATKRDLLSGIGFAQLAARVTPTDHGQP